MSTNEPFDLQSRPALARGVRLQTDASTGEPVLLINLNTTKTDPTGTADHHVALPSG